MKIDIHYWNNIIYKNMDGTFFKSNDPLTPRELNETFGINCHPIVKNSSYSHIPDKWAEDVRAMLFELKSNFGGLITINQIKEKFCELIVYWEPNENCIVDSNAVYKTISACIEKMKSKKIYPVTIYDYIKIIKESSNGE